MTYQPGTVSNQMNQGLRSTDVDSCWPYVTKLSNDQGQGPCGYQTYQTLLFITAAEHAVTTTFQLNATRLMPSSQRPVRCSASTSSTPTPTSGRTRWIELVRWLTQRSDRPTGTRQKRTNRDPGLYRVCTGGRPLARIRWSDVRDPVKIPFGVEGRCSGRLDSAAPTVAARISGRTGRPIGTVCRRPALRGPHGRAAATSGPPSSRCGRTTHHRCSAMSRWPVGRRDLSRAHPRQGHARMESVPTGAAQPTNRVNDPRVD